MSENAIYNIVSRKIFAGLFCFAMLLFASLFIFLAGCESSLEAIDATKKEEFVEIEVDDMVDCSLFSYFPNRSWIGNPIRLKYADENVNLNCIVDKGIFSTGSQYAKKVTLKSGGGFYWLPYELDQNGHLTSKNKIERAFVEIILKRDENIIGYALVEMYPINEHCFSFKAKTLKSAIFPKVEREYQSVSEEQVEEIINKIITNNRGIKTSNGSMIN